MSRIICFLLLVNLAILSLSAAAEGSPSGGAGPNPKNVRILGPASGKIYRMIRRGIDDDDMFTEDENYFKNGKRQYDDYGHMRFGKRTQPKDFDDYGHLRFGK